jgi:hypothetical protein
MICVPTLFFRGFQHRKVEKAHAAGRALRAAREQALRKGAQSFRHRVVMNDGTHLNPSQCF